MRDWQDYLTHFVPSSAYQDDALALRVLQIAEQARQRKTYAVGAMLLDADSNVLVEGANESFVDGFRSDLHAEMVVLNRWEADHSAAHQGSQLTLLTSLEPCPMCMARIIYAGIGTIRYVAPDRQGGMVHRLEALPPALLAISRDLSQSWGIAECDPELREAALSQFEASRLEMDRRLVERSI